MPTFGPIDLTEEEDAELRRIAAHPKSGGGRGKAVPRRPGRTVHVEIVSVCRIESAHYPEDMIPSEYQEEGN